MAPKRKVDPNVHFPWKTLAEKGYGLWWDDTSAVQVPPHFNSMQALRIIGYDIKDSAAAVKSFKRKFLQQDSSSYFEESEISIVFGSESL